MPPRTLAALESSLATHGRPLADFKRGDRIRAAPGMLASVGRRSYSYTLTERPGDCCSGSGNSFTPALTPGQMLALGVFEGKYLNDSVCEFPREWFADAIAAGRLSPERPDIRCNAFGVKSRQPLQVWRENGWLPRAQRASQGHGHAILSDPAQNPDERGWFQWYCRYWMGRRIPELDAIQIQRWRAFRRHEGAVRGACRRGDLTCRPRQRQALLQWAYDPTV